MRMTLWIGLLALLSVGLVAACSPSAGDETSAPVAPAIETEHPEHDSPIPMPASIKPIAPAIETDQPDVEVTFPSATEAP